MATKKKMPRRDELQRIIGAINREHPVLSPVRIKTRKGYVDTFVTAPAILLGGHNAVAYFEDIAGAVSIGDGRVQGRELN